MCHEQKVIAGEQASLCAYRCCRREGCRDSLIAKPIMNDDNRGG